MDGSTFSPQKVSKKSPPVKGETFIKKGEEVDFESFQTVYFHAIGAHPCWILEVF